MMTSIMGGQSNQWWRCLIWVMSIDIKSKFNQQSSWVAASFCLRQKLDMVGNDRYLTNKHELILLITIDIWSLFDQQSWCGCCIILPQKIWSTDKLFRKIRLIFQPPQKVIQQFFWVAQDLILVQLILIMQKITKKSLFGHFLGYPPKMHYSALQCSAMDWSASAWIIHSRWVK